MREEKLAGCFDSEAYPFRTDVSCECESERKRSNKKCELDAYALAHPHAKDTIWPVGVDPKRYIISSIG